MKVNMFKNNKAIKFKWIISNSKLKNKQKVKEKNKKTVRNRQLNKRKTINIVIKCKKIMLLNKIK